MKFKVIVAIIFLLFIFKSQAIQRISENTNTLKIETINNDSLIQTSSSTSISNQTLVSSKINLNINPINDSISHHGSPTDTIIQKVDTLLLLGNPFFIDLVYNGIPIRLDVNSQSTLKNLIYGQNESPILLNKKNQSPDEIITQLRDSARNQITRKAANLYIMTFDELPDPNVNKNRFLGKKNTSNVQLIKVDNFQNYQDKLVIKNPKISPWQYKLNSLAQFSESVISTNWYQGGNSNLAVLGILSGQLSYDDKKCIQWDNTAEWRMGFNSVAGDTIHWLSTNDDILKINSKLGIKATGNFFTVARLISPHSFSIVIKE